MVTILMMPAKMATLGLIKINVDVDVDVDVNRCRCGHVTKVW